MAKKTNLKLPPAASNLVKSRTEVRKLINEQIKASEELLNFVVDTKQGYTSDPFGTRRQRWEYDENQKEAFLAAYRQWNDFRFFR